MAPGKDNDQKPLQTLGLLSSGSVDALELITYPSSIKSDFNDFFEITTS
jgi:hypothetical protein